MTDHDQVLVAARAALADADAAGVALVRENERLRHDLSWHYTEVAYLRTAMQKALNVVLRPATLGWPGDEPPGLEASRILSEALSLARRDQSV